MSPIRVRVEKSKIASCYESMFFTSRQIALSTLLESERARMPANIKINELAGSGVACASWSSDRSGATRVVGFEICAVGNEEAHISSNGTANADTSVPVIVTIIACRYGRRGTGCCSCRTGYCGRHRSGDGTVVGEPKIDTALPHSGESAGQRTPG